jgi:hypothetical protein
MGAGIPIYKIARPAPFHALGTFTSIEAARRTSICYIGEIRSAAPERIGVVSARAGGLAVAKVRGRRHGASTLRQIDRSRAVPPTMGAPPAIVRSKRPAQENWRPSSIKRRRFVSVFPGILFGRLLLSPPYAPWLAAIYVEGGQCVSGRRPRVPSIARFAPD